MSKNSFYILQSIKSIKHHSLRLLILFTSAAMLSFFLSITLWFFTFIPQQFSQIFHQFGPDYILEKQSISLNLDGLPLIALSHENAQGLRKKQIQKLAFLLKLHPKNIFRFQETRTSFKQKSIHWIGLDFSKFLRQRPYVKIKGRLPNKKGEALIGKKISNDLSLGLENSFHPNPFQASIHIVGILETGDQEENNIYVRAEENFFPPSFFKVEFFAPSISKKSIQQIEQSFPGFSLHQRKGLPSLHHKTLHKIRLFLWITGSTLILGSLLSMIGTLAVLLTGTRKEIAIRRAFGASKQTAVSHLYFEILSAILPASILGIIVALWLSPQLIGQSLGHRFNINWLQPSVWISFPVGLFAILPAFLMIQWYLCKRLNPSVYHDLKEGRAI